jgi:hypothetical protein
MNEPNNAKVYHIGDGQIQGAEFYFSERFNQWVIVYADSWKVHFVSKLCFVTVESKKLALIQELNIVCLGADLDNKNGLWLLDQEDADEIEGITILKRFLSNGEVL